MSWKQPTEVKDASEPIDDRDEDSPDFEVREELARTTDFGGPDPAFGDNDER